MTILTILFLLGGTSCSLQAILDLVAVDERVRSDTGQYFSSMKDVGVAARNFDIFNCNVELSLSRL